MALAGGTDVIVDRHLLPVDRATAIDCVIDLTGIADFHAIERCQVDGRSVLRFAGGVTYWDLRQSRDVGAHLPMLADMARDVGAVQIQTRGTLAGNVASASPAADGVAALLALGATLELVSAKGTRRVALKDALLGYRKTALVPGELIGAIEVVVPSAGAKVFWRKVGTRLAQAISKVALASVVELDGDVVRSAAFGVASVAATTHALGGVSLAVAGASLAALDRAAVDAAVANDIRPIDDVRSTGPYRLHVTKALVRQALFS